MKRLTLRIPNYLYADLKRNAKLMEQSINQAAIEALEKGQKWQLKQIKARLGLEEPGVVIKYSIDEIDPKMKEAIEVAKTKWLPED